MLNFCDFIQVFVFTANHHRNDISLFTQRLFFILIAGHGSNVIYNEIVEILILRY